MTEDQQVPPGIDPATPSPARLYDYYLGGTNNFRADRDAAERIRARMPELADAAWANRGSISARRSGWPGRPASASSSTSDPACPLGITPIRRCTGPPARPASSTSTTTVASRVVHTWDCPAAVPLYRAVGP
jgi:hypothetical protein